MAGDHAVAERLAALHAEGRGSVDREGIQLDERPGVDQRLDPLASRQLAAGVLLLSRLRVGRARLLAAAAQLFDTLLGGLHGNSASGKCKGQGKGIQDSALIIPYSWVPISYEVPTVRFNISARYSRRMPPGIRLRHDRV